MIPVIISELRGWVSNFGRTSITAFVIAAALAGGLSLVQPRACLIPVIVMLTWLGWAAGLQRWEILKAWAWIKREGISPALYVAGKFLGGIALCAIHLFFIAPVIVLMLLVWGLPFELFLLTALLGLLCYWLALGVGLAVHRDGAVLAGLPAGILVFAWAVLCIGLAELRPFSPFLQVWNVLGEGGVARFAGTSGFATGFSDAQTADTVNAVSVLPAVLANAGLVAALFGFAVLRQRVWKRR